MAGAFEENIKYVMWNGMKFLSRQFVYEQNTWLCEDFQTGGCNYSLKSKDLL